MAEFNYDFTKADGRIKPVNAVNNGPCAPNVRGMSNFEDYKALEIPYARNHDASFYADYGGEHIVDVHRIFKDFDADENDPASYVFEPTDKYLNNIYLAGTKVFYRLGASIEHGYKYGTRPPKDFAKWARICEHIIRHYTEGWADGFYYDIEYWEIWNEPECSDGGKNPCWQGTNEQFIDFYEIAAKHLKSCFPHLKIGGPAFCCSYMNEVGRELRPMFFKALKERNIPIDFYSFHGYPHKIESVFSIADAAVDAFRDYGLDLPELIFDEWNYVRGWVGEDYVYSRERSREIKGASFNIGVMCAGQASALDMLMYYDARPSNWCGFFNPETFKPRKPYYGYYLFREIPRLGGYVKSEPCSGNFWSLASTDGTNGALIVTHFNDDDTTKPDTVKIKIKAPASKVRAEYYLLDGEHNGELVREEIFSTDSFNIYLKMKLFDTYLIKLSPLA